MREYSIKENSIHEKFLNSTAPYQIFGGGFGNGKTTVACIKAIKLSQEYPGSNGLIARSTFPKLNDTIRKEFKKWCPPDLISSFPESKNSDNTAKLKNGTHINFRYIAQQGKSAEQTTSNLLSATYDWAIVDQMEDPEISEKDFLDLQGRMRGTTIYRGSDIKMPKTGPRFMMLTVNPTANWFYKKLVRPLKIYETTGRITDDLLCERDMNAQPILIDGKPILLLELFEGPTHANAAHLPADFIRNLESSYKGQMRDRFLLGKWAAFEGLVYPEFSEEDNVISHDTMLNYMDDLAGRGYKFNWVEGYDFGIASPSCYLLGFVDPNGIIHYVAGFHEKEMRIEDQVAKIKEIRAKHGVPPRNAYADPSIFRRGNAQRGGTVGKSTSELFYEEGQISFIRGNNDIANGIVKVSSYLIKRANVMNPYTGDYGSPMMYFSDELSFLNDEFTSYMWKKNNDGTTTDEPVDKNDHGMDTIKYSVSDRPALGSYIKTEKDLPQYLQWQEVAEQQDSRYARYGN